MRDWVNFIKALCHAIEEVVNHKIILLESLINPSIVIGKVQERYSNNVIVGVFDRCWLEKGQRLIFITETKYVKTNILSLKLNSIDMSGIWVHTSGIEVGIKTDIKVGKKSKIIAIQ